jgi:ATPase family associated with various cellular activities (AAA)
MQSTWHEQNQQSLMAAIAQVRSRLCQAAQIETPSLELSDQSFSSALDQLSEIFGLSAFDREVLLLCAGMEFDSGWAALCAEAQGDSQLNYPTFGLALRISLNSDWAGLLPTAPLRRWRLIEIGGGNALTASPLRIDERILHYLAGLSHLDDRLSTFVQSVELNSDPIQPSHQQIAAQISDLWQQDFSSFAIVQLCGADPVSQRAIAATACHKLGLSLHTLNAELLPTDSQSLHLIQRLWEREAILINSALLLNFSSDLLETEKGRSIIQLMETVRCPLILMSRDRHHPRQRHLITFEIPPLTRQEQYTVWQNALENTDLNGTIETLVSHFNLNATTIQTISRTAEHHTQNILWNTCRIQARPNLDSLAQRIESDSEWNDLILPEREQQILQDIAIQVRQRAKVYETWGFAGKGGRGLGISALFAGSSGTGKTLAAETLATALKLDLYRIDLSAVVSKYIGETEKNLRRVFDAAETGGVILLFDEADAIFGKRSEVKDSHDRHANIEVSYLLQRMEAYRGLAILTTNLKDSLDTAFLRRIRFVVQFPFPDAKQRADIWRQIFPTQTPTQGLDFDKLAKLTVAGGNIRNIALNAAFLAAEANQPVMMTHLLQAAKREYVKLERSIADSEVKGWV